MKTVSVVIPVYNVSQYLSACIDSILAQTYSQLEIILIDDGSTDNSGEICDQYAQKDERVRVIHQPNSGSATAKNTGLDHATGAYIAFVDSDDFVDSQWLFKAVTTLESHHADLVEYAFKKVYVSHSEPGNTRELVSGQFSTEEYMAQYPFDWTCSLFCNKIFKTELTNGIRFRKERRCIDDEFYTYKVASRANKILRINESLYYYRQRSSSAISSEKNKLQISDDAVEVLIERYNWISTRFPSLRNVYLQHDLSALWDFANRLQFSPFSARKLKKTVKFYTLQCLLHYPAPYLLRLSLRLLCVTRQKLLDPKPTTTFNLTHTDYFT